jgi:malate dehydrogenase (oxaloacetate-decarboxylating)(NADP+)
MPGTDKSDRSISQVTDQEALDFHARGRPGKLEINPTKPMATQRDLSLAYSPGVAVPVKAIAEDPSRAFDYTAKGNMVAVISNGTAILGLGNLGALASKPVMEGKAVLFKRFADVDSIDLRWTPRMSTSSSTACAGAELRRHQSRGHQGARLFHHRAAPARDHGHSGLPRRPARHRHHRGRRPDQRAASDRPRSQDVKLVCNGAGAAASPASNWSRRWAHRTRTCIAVRHQGRDLQGPHRGHEPVEIGPRGRRPTAHAGRRDGRRRRLPRRLGQGRGDPRWLRSMAKNPIIFAMANPDPEITPEEVAEMRNDAIMATGRSDYPNQVNNVLGFPYIFRGALDVRAPPSTRR